MGLPLSCPRARHSFGFVEGDTMKVVVAALLLFVGALALADYQYSRQELETMSHPQLVDLVLHLQRDGTPPPAEHLNCTTYDPLNGAIGTLMTRVQHNGYSDDGSLKWPSGILFMKAHRGYNDDASLYYPDGRLFMLRHSGYNDDRTISWPGNPVMLRRHSGYNDDATVYHSDGSTWLLRHRGYNDDRQRYGMPVEDRSYGNFRVSGRLDANDNLLTSIVMTGSGWKLQVNFDSSNELLGVTECFNN